jgi:integrase
MKSANRRKTWEKTRIQYLLRHKSGRYYARAYADGKEVWRSLRTNKFSVAEARLSDFIRQQRSLAGAKNSGSLTFGAALALHLRRLNDAVEAGRIKPSTLHYWRQIFAALLKSWPGLESKDVRQIKADDCEAWAREFAKHGSASRFNNTLDGLRHVLRIAVKASLIYTNPASELERVQIRQKELSLPSIDEFRRLLIAIRTAGAWCSKQCGDFVEGLALTGIRLREANELEWRDLNFHRGEIIVRGNPNTGTKNWSVYRAPMVPRARELFETMRAERRSESPTSKVFEVRESQRALDSACRKLGILRITHHDLRHLFATVCIESGVDIPTVSRWLNHKDGGALVMKTYGHLRRQHSMTQAKRVNFSPVPAPENVVEMEAAS